MMEWLHRQVEMLSHTRQVHGGCDHHHACTAKYNWRVATVMTVATTVIVSGAASRLQPFDEEHRS